LLRNARTKAFTVAQRTALASLADVCRSNSSESEPKLSHVTPSSLPLAFTVLGAIVVAEHLTLEEPTVHQRNGLRFFV
jgi:hypothetical protein